MRRIDKSPLDIFKRDWRIKHDPLAAQKMHVRSSDTVPLRPASTLPHENLITDPLANLANAEEQFHSYQVSSGLEILKHGQGIDTAADEQNVRAAQEATEKQNVAPVPQPPLLNPADRQHHLEPFNDPFSTVPGGLGPIMPLGWFPPGM